MPSPRRPLEVVRLETRETPATRVDDFTVLYRDTDGDATKVVLSRPLFTDEAAAGAILKFDGGTVDGSTATPQQLQAIDLTKADPQQARGATVTVTATRNVSTGGDGFAAVGTVIATGIDLGDVVIDGDLGDVQAGDANLKNPAIGTLKANSMGRFGTATGGTLVSNLVGRVGGVAVKTSAVGVTILVTGGSDGNLGSLTIGGSLVGGSTDKSGLVHATGDIGPVVVGGNLVGGAGADTGAIWAGGKLGDVTIKGSLWGGAGLGSSAVSADGGGMGVVRVGGDLRGDGPFSASLTATLGAVSVTVGGSVVGGGGDNSALVRFEGPVGPVTIGHDVVGGGFDSGRVAGLRLGNVTIGGSLVGGTGNGSGELTAPQGIGNVTVKGDVRGGAGTDSGAIDSGAGLGRVTVLGSVVGGDGTGSAHLSAANDLAGVIVGGSVRGGAGDTSARIQAGGRLVGRTPALTPLGLTVGGSLVAGTGVGSASVRAGKDIGPIVVKGSLDGSAGRIVISAVGAPTATTTDLAIRSLTVAGDVVNATVLAGYNVIGTAMNGDAQVGPVTVGGDWVASTMVAGVTPGVDAVFATADDQVIAEPTPLGTVFAKIASERVGGQLIGTTAAGDGFGFTAEQIGSLSVGGLAIPLHAGKSNDAFLFGQDLDVRLQEVPDAV